MKNITNIKKSFKLKKRYRRIFSAIMAVTSFLYLVSPFAVEASAGPINKEEVVYVNLNADGSVQGVYVVNILKGGGEFKDYGNYSSIRNMTTFDNLTLDNGVVAGKTDADNLYYEGILDNAQVPWNISVTYLLDGKEYSASEIAGKSGDFELKISIKQNTNFNNSTFFDNYALQVSVTLDNKGYKNIKTEEATIANIGSNKQLTYTVLPGNEKDISITAEVTDLRMDPISINGVRLNLSVDFDDEELLDQVGYLIDGILKVNDGAKELHDGTSELKQVVKDDLMSGVPSLQNGAVTLDGGITTLKMGISDAQNGLNQLNENSGNLNNGSAEMKSALLEIQSALSAVSFTTDKLLELTAASSQIKTGINELNSGVEALQNSIGYAQYKAAMAGNGLDIDILVASNNQTISDISVQIVSLEQTIASLPDTEVAQKAQLQMQIDQLTAISSLLGGNNAAIGGAETYLGQLSVAVGSLYDGIGQMKKQYTQFDIAIRNLTDTLTGLLVDVSVLSNGINRIVDEYSRIDSGIKEYTDGVATLAVGYTQIVDGMSSLSDGSKALSSGINDLNSGTNSLYEGITTLNNGTLELSNGTSEMRNETDGMDTKIYDKIDSVLGSVSGGKGEVLSFVSEKNTEIQSVQFVIQTEAIDEIIVTDIPEEQEKSSLFKKILILFGF
ncbi:MAG: hypothetical protein ACRCZK_07590 [Oscillospiraceae bacterium]